MTNGEYSTVKKPLSERWNHLKDKNNPRKSKIEQYKIVQTSGEVTYPT